MLAQEPKNMSLWALNLNVSRYPTAIEGVYNIHTDVPVI